MVDFESKKILGGVLIRLASPTQGIFDLDTRSLKVLWCRTGDGREIPSELGGSNPIFGSRLRLDLPERTREIIIEFETTDGSTALDWLAPEQTAGRRLPYLYSQCQPHHARSIFPCQDSPRARFRFTAAITVPKGHTAVMAAASTGSHEGANPNTTTFTFDMPQPIPSYLTAFAVGDIVSRDLSDRVRIWAEPEVIDSAAWEFGEVDPMIGLAEGIFGAYEWDRYDMIVMPFSFPYGGMENPRLTFLTPTLLAGDRSLVNVVAHELAHSWTGNLVTNATMEDFWINEGFTVWAERRILEALEGTGFAALHAANGRTDLEAAMADFGPESPYTQLKTPMEGVDPDEVYSVVPYEKGFLFVTLLEQTLGREQFDAVVGRYMEKFRFTSITTEELLQFLEEEAPGLLDRVGVQEWVYQKGLPANAPVFTSPALEHLRSLAEGWDRGVRPESDQVRSWSTEEWLLYLNALPKVLSVPGCQELDGAFGLSQSGNYEILVAWLTLAVRSGYEEVLPRVREVLTTVGRAKFLRPLYQELIKRDELRAFATEVFDEMRDRYHTLARVAIAGIFEKASKTG